MLRIGELPEVRVPSPAQDLVHPFGIHPGVVVKHVQTAHPDNALPRIR